MEFDCDNFSCVKKGARWLSLGTVWVYALLGFFFHPQLVVTWKIFFFQGNREASLHLLAELVEKLYFII